MCFLLDRSTHVQLQISDLLYIWFFDSEISELAVLLIISADPWAGMRYPFFFFLASTCVSLLFQG